MLRGAIVVASESVGIHRVEVPLVRIHREVVLRAVGPRQPGELARTLLQDDVDALGIAGTGECLGLLGVELHGDRVGRVGRPAGFHRREHMLVPALSQGEPGGHLVGPGEDLAVSGLVAEFHQLADDALDPDESLAMLRTLA